ncbi:MAG: chemotaxis protein CheW [Gammaproteobacteria bacterium]
MHDERMPQGGIDWDAIKKRLAEVGAALEQILEPSPEDTRRILKARAEDLAKELPGIEKTAVTLEFVEFELAYERYAFDLQHVREVCSLQSFTPLPCTPAFVLGIVNLRGEILSVIDLKKFFDLPEQGLSDLNKVVVLQSADMTFGILADRIIGTRELPGAGIQSVLPTLSGIRETYLLGVTSERTVILDAQKLLASKDLIVHEQVTG